MRGFCLCIIVISVVTMVWRALGMLGVIEVQWSHFYFFMFAIPITHLIGKTTKKIKKRTTLNKMH